MGKKMENNMVRHRMSRDVFAPWRHDEAPGDDAGIAQVQELPTGGETRDIYPWKTCGTYGCL